MIEADATASRRGAHPQPRTYTVASVLTALMLAVLATLVGPLGSLPSAHADDYPCAGGSGSGGASSSGGTCPDLHNNDLLPERTFPRDLFRGDSREPNDIFNNGFTARGANYDLQAHVQGDRAMNSGYVSTTGTVGVAEQFARSQGLSNLASAAAQPRCSTSQLAFYAFIPGVGNWLTERCLNGTVTAETFVYTIDPVWASNALYVPDEIRGNAGLHDHYASQDEWAYVHQVPNYAITGVRIYRTTATAQGDRISPQTITFTYDQWVPNPNHINQRLYQPSDDPAAQFNFDTYLNTPALAANPWTRPCDPAHQCRDGGGNG
ncbi:MULTISPECIES: hypothetical protein [unclassified Streptomyces]|uniref:hypothetical protein n=1 Tax=unclassified Streptomyces TaxID=2593676 RepID=UPI0022538DEC|nr:MULTISPECIES: hypothetical protein [unclassified Streptomyces]MCX5048969.1 hypothetical protein [Streptomyces sp. NBC_00474]